MLKPISEQIVFLIFPYIDFLSVALAAAHGGIPKLGIFSDSQRALVLCSQLVYLMDSTVYFTLPNVRYGVESPRR